MGIAEGQVLPPDEHHEVYDGPSVCLPLKVRMVIAEVTQTALYGCITWSPSKFDHDCLRKARQLMLSPMPRLAATNAQRPHPILGDPLVETYCAGGWQCSGVARMEEERWPCRVIFGEMGRVKDYSGGQEKDRIGRLEQNLNIFGIKVEG